MARTREEWWEWVIEKGTSGDVVYDILGDWKEENDARAESEPVAKLHCSDGLDGLIRKWQDREKEMGAKSKNWITIPSDARFLGRAEATRVCLSELQDELKKAD